jgi:hypothetical protein
MSVDAAMDFRPVFIFGVARSGTNLLARMVGAHAEASVALDPLMPLFRFWRNAVAPSASHRLKRRLDPAAPFQDYYFNPDGPTLLDAVLEADPDLPVDDETGLTEAVCARAALESESLGRRFAGWRGRTVAERFADALRLIAQEAGEQGRAATLIGIKEVWTVEFAAPLARAFPEAKFLIVHRDPRAVLASLLTLMKKDATQAAHTISYLRHWRKHVAVSQHLLGAPDFGERVMAIRFEDVVASPSEWVKNLAKFLEIELHPAMLAPGDDDGWRGNSSFGETRGIDSAAAERWRGVLPTRLAAAADFHCGPEMQMIGYCPDHIDGHLTDDVLAAVKDADAEPGSWRSDGGNIDDDLAWECLRWQLARGGKAPEEVIRRCFLFSGLLQSATHSGLDRPVGELQKVPA